MEGNGLGKLAGTVRPGRPPRWILDPERVAEGDEGVRQLAMVLAMMGVGVVGLDNLETAQAYGVGDLFVRDPAETSLIVPGVGQMKPPGQS